MGELISEDQRSNDNRRDLILEEEKDNGGGVKNLSSGWGGGGGVECSWGVEFSWRGGRIFEGMEIILEVIPSLVVWGGGNNLG